MIVAKLTASYNRGAKYNDPQDLAAKEGSRVLNAGEKTKDGKIIRGIGTHFTSERTYEEFKARDAEFARVRRLFRQRFMVTPLDGVYIVPSQGAGKKFVDSLDIRKDMDVRVNEFHLTNVGSGSMDDAEMSEWTERVKKQFKELTFGRDEESQEESLRCLEFLAECPAVNKSTTHRIKEMTAMVRAKKMDRVELKRKIVTMDIKIDAEALSPRRAQVA